MKTRILPIPFAILLASALSTRALADAGDASVLRIRTDATIRAAHITLGDVLLLDGVDADLHKKLESAPLIPDRKDTGLRTATFAQIQRRLEQLDVNLGRVLLAGAAECRIVRLEAPAKKSGEVGATLAADVQNADGAHQAAPVAASLADLLKRQVEKEFADAHLACELEFERAGQEYLQLTSPPWEFNIHAATPKQLGVREFRVTILRDGQTQRTVQIAARVKATRTVLVARKPLAVGTYVQRDDVELEKRIFDDAADFGFAQTESAVGQQLKHFIAQGEMLKTTDLKVVDLVQRSRPVAILDNSGAVNVRMSGIALDSGGLGDSIRVRIGEGKTRRELRGTVTAFGTVRIDGGQ